VKGEMLQQLKRVVKVAISAFFYCGSAVSNFLRKLVGAEVLGTCVVLHYHSVSDENRGRFSRHMDEVRRLTISISADHRQPLAQGKRYSVITIDDGFRSANENGIPELLKRKIPVTVFISPDLIGTTPKWATFDGDQLENEQIVSVEDMKKWPDDLVTIGSHTLTHPWLPSSTEGEARTELKESRDKLKQLLNKDADLFSFPYGASNEKLIQMCREAGYRRVFTNSPRLAFSDPEEFVTGRLKAEPTDWPIEFRLKLLGAYRWMPAVSAWKRKFFPMPPESITS
jgi:peptidoglycan/xylan/chitin deacetylase (PgdA/CDA1 family)